ncbi:MAG: hypothetical protein E7434_00955 [Ruminococcaceae bacterium]|nr:hypothetical protein [Oscillospiraceae bacterium]
MTGRFETFTVLIAQINRCIYKIKTEEMAEFALKSSHVSCLYYLHKDRSLTATQLCQVCGEDKANVSRSIKFLEANGYITCESNAKKRYQSAFSLTPKGADIGARIAEKIDAVLSLSSAGLCDDELAIMYKGLTLVQENLNRICASYEQAEEAT